MDDLDRIMAVMQAAFDPAYGEAWNRRQVEDALAMPGTHYLLAGQDGLPPEPGMPTAGFAMSRGAVDEEELLLIAVHPDYRGQGIGTQLVKSFVCEAISRGATRLFLEMRESNPAESLYLHAGFEKVGRRRNYYRRGHGEPIDAITFAKDVKDNGSALN